MHAFSFRPIHLLLTVMATAWTSPAEAHEFWIAPTAHTVELGARLTLDLQVGEGFRGEVLPRDERAIDRFDARLGLDRRLVVAGRHGLAPAGMLGANESGLLTVAYQSRGHYVELAPAEFEGYLEEEGQRRTAELRRQRGETETPGRETFQRCAKALVRVGQASTAGWDRPLGLDLEIVPLSDPFEPKARERSFRVLWRNRPLSGIRVNAQRRGEPEHVLRIWTDEHGVAVLPIDHTDDWLIHAVHIEPAPAEARADWHSYWASLTTRFVVHEAD